MSSKSPMGLRALSFPKWLLLELQVLAASGCIAKVEPCKGKLSFKRQAESRDKTQKENLLESQESFLAMQFCNCGLHAVESL